MILIELLLYLILVMFAFKGTLRRTSVRYTPSVSVIISAYKEDVAVIQQCINSIEYEGDVEVLLIVDGTQAPKGVCGAEIVLKDKRRGHTHSMNLGISLAKGEVVVMLDADTSLHPKAIQEAVNHFKDESVEAVSGTLKARNVSDSWITRLQDIEYTLGIQLGRFGLGEMGMVNNISGAFGVFKTDMLKRIGGWTEGAAEDLDMTLKLHTYGIKVATEPRSIAYTEVPVTARELFIQRMRWDGDLYIIYLKRGHLGKLSFKHILMITWYGIFLQVVSPFLIVATLLMQPIAIYLLYLSIMTIMYLVVEGKPNLMLVFSPIYSLVLRVLGAFFILNEALFEEHKNSNYLPQQENTDETA